MTRFGEYAELVAKRAAFLEALEAEPRYKNELIDQLDTSRSTVDRAVRELETASLIRKELDGYRTTAHGSAALSAYRNATRTFAATNDLGSSLAAIGPTPNIDATLLIDAEVSGVTADSAVHLTAEITDAIRSASRFALYLPSLTDTEHVTAAAEAVLRNGATGELYLHESLFGAVDRRYPDTVAELLAADDATVGVAEPFDYGLLWVRVEGEQHVRMLLFEDGQFHSSTHTTAPRAGAAADRLFDRVQATATPAAEIGATHHETPEPGGAPRLPETLRAEGFDRLDGADIGERAPSTVAEEWRTGISIAGIDEGYAVERTREDRSTVEEVLSLADTGHTAILGRPGAGKTVLARQVAYRWLTEDRGSVYYRGNGDGRAVESTSRLARQAESEDGTTLIVVEDACRPNTDEVLSLTERLDPDEATLLVDSRRTEWLTVAREEYGAAGPFGTYDVPAFTDEDADQFVAVYDSLVDGSAVEAGAVYDRLPDDDAAEPVGPAIATDLSVFVHRLCAYTDAGARGDADSAVDRTMQELLASVADDPATLDLAVHVSVLSVLGIRPTAANVYALCADHDEGAVEAALERLTGELLVSETDDGTPSFRTVHEAWTWELLRTLPEVESEREARRRVIGAVERLLRLATDRELRGAIERAVEAESAPLRVQREDPLGWQERVLEALFDFVSRYNAFAILLSDGGDVGVPVPESVAPDRRDEWLEAFGRALIQCGRPDEATEAFETLVDRGRDRNATATEARGKLCLAEVESRHGNHERAIELATAAATAFDAIGAEYERLRAAYQRAVDRGRAGDLAVALDRLAALASEFSDRGDDQYVAKCQVKIGQFSMNNAEFDRSEAAVRDALEAVPEEQEPRLVSNAHVSIGNLLKLREEFEAAADHYRRALHVSRVAGDLVGESHALMSLGELERDRANVEQAREYLEAGVVRARKVAYPADIGVALNNLGILEKNQGNIDRAMSYHEEALEYRRGLEQPKELANSLYNIGETHLAAGELEEAADACGQAAELFEEVGFEYGRLAAVAALGGIEAERGNATPAREQLRTAFEGYVELDAVGRALDALERLVEFEAESGEDDEAVALAVRGYETATEHDHGSEAGTFRTWLVKLDAADAIPDEGEPVRSSPE